MSGQGRPDPRRTLGARGEAIVARWYEQHGYKVVARNWRCREGELDLVLTARGLLVFCEVKTRSSVAFGVPAEAVTPRKQQRIRLLASRWLADNNVRARSLRFDVASVLIAGETDPIVEVIEAAF